jgi:hypothetical protein
VLLVQSLVLQGWSICLFNDPVSVTSQTSSGCIPLHYRYYNQNESFSLVQIVSLGLNCVEHTDGLNCVEHTDGLNCVEHTDGLNCVEHTDGDRGIAQSV